MYMYVGIKECFVCLLMKQTLAALRFNATATLFGFFMSFTEVVELSSCFQIHLIENH